MSPATPEKPDTFVANSDTFKGTPAEGVTTVKFGPEGSAGDLTQRRFGSISIAEQNRLAAESDTPPALRTPEGAAAARAGLTTSAPDVTAPAASSFSSRAGTAGSSNL